MTSLFQVQTCIGDGLECFSNLTIPDNSCITNCQGMNAKVDISNVNDDIKIKPEVVQFLNDYESYKNGYHNPTNIPEDIKSTV